MEFLEAYALRAPYPGEWPPWPQCYGFPTGASRNEEFYNAMWLKLTFTALLIGASYFLYMLSKIYS